MKRVDRKRNFRGFYKQLLRLKRTTSNSEHVERSELYCYYISISLQIVAAETETPQKLSSTATLTVTVTDANDNRPVFEHESYSFTVSETAVGGQLIGAITAKDLDAGRYGTNGIRYSLSGTGAELFDVNEKTGAITVATCSSLADNRSRLKRQVSMSVEQQATPTASATPTKKVNLTIVGETGFIDVDDMPAQLRDDTTTEVYFPFTELQHNDNSHSDEQLTFRQFFNIGDDYMVMSDSGEETTTHGTDSSSYSDERTVDDDEHVVTRRVLPQETGPGHAPCLDYETQSVYFLSYKVSWCAQIYSWPRQRLYSFSFAQASDDNGIGQTSVVSLRISLLDANDSPPVCESPLYRASLDEGASTFDPPLIIRARDPDAISQMNYR